MAPGVGDLAAFEHDVIDRPFGQQPAGGKTRMAGADDDRRDAFDGRSSGRCAQATSTVMFTGLASASKTAERFCDCATSASMSFFGASASILKVTLMLS